MKRFLAMLLAAIVVVGIAATSDRMGSGHRTDGLYYAASGIHPDAKLLKINDKPVSAEEYLYWLAYDCEYLTTYSSDLDWDSEVSEGMTYAQYAKTDALEAVKLYAIVRQWASEAGITLTEEDLADLENERQQYVDYYGGEEAYARQIELLGVSNETYNDINSVYFLYAAVLQAFCDPNSSLYPGEDAVNSFASDNNYVTVKLLYLPTVGIDNKVGISAQKNTAKKYAQQLREAKDVNKVYQKLAKKLGMEESDYPEEGLTFSTDNASVDAKLAKAINKLKVGEVSGVISCDNGFYVAVRTELDQATVLNAFFEATLQQEQESAKVIFNDKLYDAIVVGDFYDQLLQARSERQQEFAAADGETADEGQGDKPETETSGD